MRRPHSGFWGAERTAPAGSPLLEDELALSLAKNARELALPRVFALRDRAWFPSLAAPALAGEPLPLAPVGAVVLPAPHVDVDPTFIHRHWTFEANTTRRSDHEARYRVTWGPFVARLLSAPRTEAAHAWSGASGPAGARTLGGRLAAETALAAVAEQPRIAAEGSGLAHAAPLEGGRLYRLVGALSAHAAGATAAGRLASTLAAGRGWAASARSALSQPTADTQA